MSGVIIAVTFTLIIIVACVVTGRAPVYAHLSNCIHGIQVIKAFKKQDHVMKHFHQSQNVHSSVWLHYYLSSRWLSVRFEWGLILYLMLSLVTAFWTKHRGNDLIIMLFTVN